MASNKPRELSAAMLRGVVDPESLGLQSTENACSLEEPLIAQERAQEALNFALGMKGLDYNAYVAGPAKSDMETLTRVIVNKAASQKDSPPDLLYVNNFKDSEQPRIISLKKGMGAQFKKDIEEFIEVTQAEIPEVFESEDYNARKDEINKEYETVRKGVLEKLDEDVRKEGFILNVGQTGMMIIPAEDDAPMSEEKLRSLDDDKKKELRDRSEKLQTRMSEVVRQLRKLEKEYKKRKKEQDQEIALYVVGHHVEELKEKYKFSEEIQGYLEEVKEDIVQSLDDFRQKSAGPQLPLPMAAAHTNLTRYEVNVFVDNSELEGAPVIFESNPTFPNLFGAIERKAQFGALFTDFTMIRPGAIHRANGGFLVIKVLDILKHFYSYEGIKRALKSGEISVEDLGEQLGIFSTRVLRPQAVKLNLKVVLIGSSLFYHLLYFYDEDFPKLFKVKAHMDNEIKTSSKEIQDYISFMCTVVEKHELPHLDKTGVARVIEYGAELAGRRDKLSLETTAIADIIKEAAYWAGQADSDLIAGEHVERAIRRKKYRSNLYEERVQELIQEETLKIQTSGEAVGQINGLSVIDLGDYMFGRPSRITATVALGKEGVVDIEREAELSGAFHTKGVMILDGYLKNKYAQDVSLSLTASIAFEQSYSYIDGDSASGAELFALLSAIGKLPLKQSIAVTGSVSQFGEVQPIGGVNHKIEGFFDVCSERGLTGAEGVIIPVGNTNDLMLKTEVVEAVREGKFHVYAVGTIDEGMAILTGLKPGNLRKDGSYTKGSLNDVVKRSLKEMFDRAKKLDHSK